MRVRHLVAAVDVRDGIVVDPSRVRHGVIRAGRVAALAGRIDPATHLNLDFPEHRLAHCTVVERFEVGAAALMDADGRSCMAEPSPDAFLRLGRVDVGRRRAAWSAAFTDRIARGGVGR